eukprot:comp12556_c0_seq1/m.7553 comp12556_c0_seq1/g.7553  ORF comp12556_c0_seq1/g.7553 comp12556_c0_seq1/m.7553 type:complete len:482 (-) comp12556_c0_seq1:416-1861(-)
MQAASSKTTTNCKVLKEGWLYKRGVYIKNWRPRYFQLLSNGVLHGYKSGAPEGEDEDALNEFSVANCKVAYADHIKKGTFIITFLEETNVVERIFRAESEKEREEWREAINKVCQQMAAARVAEKKLSEGPMSPGTRRRVEDKQSKEVGIDTRLKIDDFRMLRVLGKGTFGKVVLAHRKDSGEIVAIKMLRKDIIVESEDYRHTLTESRVLRKMKHPFLTGLKACFQTEDRLCFVMEFVNGGELLFHLSKARVFPVHRARFYGAEILLALSYLHEHAIVYRDLKLENLLLDRDGHVKITDFGLCKENVNYGDTTQTFCGTAEYLAPEVLEDNDYSRAVDWWGLGIVMFEMLCGYMPFQDADHECLFTKILREDIVVPEHVQAIPHVHSLLMGLLAKDPQQRLGGGKTDGLEIMQHPFFAAINFDDLYHKRIVPPFKPEVTSDTDVSNFDAMFTSQDVALSPTDSSFLANHQFDEFEYIPGA